MRTLWDNLISKQGWKQQAIWQRCRLSSFVNSGSVTKAGATKLCSLQSVVMELHKVSVSKLCFVHFSDSQKLLSRLLLKQRTAWESKIIFTQDDGSLLVLDTFPCLHFWTLEKLRIDAFILFYCINPNFFLLEIIIIFNWTLLLDLTVYGLLCVHNIFAFVYMI